MSLLNTLMTHNNVVQVEDAVEVKRLKNPFMANPFMANPFTVATRVSFPVGTVFTTENPDAEGYKCMERVQHAIIQYALDGTIDSSVKATPYRLGATFYKNQLQTVFVEEPSVKYTGDGDYWEDVTLTEEIIRFNGLEPEYEFIGVIEADKLFRRGVK